MKISGIDKDFETIIYELDQKGFKPFASCDGVLANHEDPKEVNQAYISFLKSPKIIDLMAAFLTEKEKFSVAIGSQEYVNAHELYGNIIEGNTYGVYFQNKMRQNTSYFEDIARNIMDEKMIAPKEEKRKLEELDKVLEENSDSELTFQIIFNGEYAPYMGKSEKINQLVVMTKAGEEKIEDKVSIKTERDMQVLANLLAQKDETSQFVIDGQDRGACSVYFTDEDFPFILEQIQYISQIAPTLPTFEAREWIGSEEELEEMYDDYYDEMWELEEEEMQEMTPLEQREEKLSELEEELARLIEEEKELSQLNLKDGEDIEEEK